jgi:chromosome segregation ATPase
MKIATLIFVVIALVLGAALILQQKRTAESLGPTRTEAMRFSNEWRQARTQLDERDRVMASIETALNRRNEELATATTQLAQAKGDLAQTKNDLTKAQGDLRAAQTELEKKTTQVNELEGEKDALTKTMNELTNSIQLLEVRIADTKRKLANAEGNRDFLLQELKRLQDEKATLAAQFNDLAALRAQISKLKEEAAVNQRLTWMQQGLYQRRDMKGAEALFSPSAPDSLPGSRLNVEVERTGSSRVVPETNAPAAPR